MENFLKKMEDDLDNKILSCIKGQTIVKPFNKVYDRVRKSDEKKIVKTTNKKTLIYPEGEESIYKQIIAKFLEENPEFLNSETA